jgi:hypothetical protein
VFEDIWNAQNLIPAQGLETHCFRTKHAFWCLSVLFQEQGFAGIQVKPSGIVDTPSAD